MLSLRLATFRDERLLLRWRNDAKVRAMSLESRKILPDEHRQWFHAAIASGNPSILIVQHQGRDNGVVRVHRDPTSPSEGAWSCQVGDSQAPLGFGATLPLVALAWGFGELALSTMRAEVLSGNSNMLSIHKRLRINECKDCKSATGSTIQKFVVHVHEAPAILARGASLLPKHYQIPSEIVAVALRRANSEGTS